MDPESLTQTTSVADAEEERANAAVVRRIRTTAVAAYFLFAGGYVLRLDWLGLVGLTCTSLLVMINFLWLEDIVCNVLEPAPQVKAWKLGIKTLARFFLFALALSVAIFVVRFNVLSVLLGISIVVIGIMGEAAYALFLSLKSE
jgi:hypothetical protein